MPGTQESRCSVCAHPAKEAVRRSRRVSSAGLLVETARRRLSPIGEAVAEPEPPPLSCHSSVIPSSDQPAGPSGEAEMKYCCQPPSRPMRNVRSYSRFVTPA